MVLYRWKNCKKIWTNFIILIWINLYILKFRFKMNLKMFHPHSRNPYFLISTFQGSHNRFPYVSRLGLQFAIKLWPQVQHTSISSDLVMFANTFQYNGWGSRYFVISLIHRFTFKMLIKNYLQSSSCHTYFLHSGTQLK